MKCKGKRDAHSSSSMIINRAAALYPQHRPAKRSAPVEKSTAKMIKTEDIREKKNPPDKYKRILVTAARPQQTDYELSPSMTNIVENELNLLMNKIYESFPKEITNEAEKVVYNKYKGEVGAALRNTIGLNITKRLLNVHDRLLVKLTFSSVPSGKDLDKFINAYKLINFKKVAHLGHTYVADLKSYNDLDNLCSAKNLYCGNVEITAKPCIPFMKCSQNLKTKFRSAFILTEQKQTDAQSENILESKIKAKQENTDHGTEITTKDDNKTKNSKIDKVQTKECKESNVKPKSQEVTKATTQNKSQETPKVTQKSQASNKVTESTKVSNTQTKTQETAKQTQAKPEAVVPKVKTTSTKMKESVKAKTTIIKTEDTTNVKTTAIKTEKTTPTKTEATSKAKTTPGKTEVTASTIKTEETKPKTTAPKIDTDKPKTNATNTETTATKTEEIPKTKSSETVKVITATKTDTTKAKTTPTKAEAAPNATTPAKTESKVSKPQDTSKINITKPNTQENKGKTQNELNKSTTQTKTQEVKTPTTTKSKEEIKPNPQAKPVNTTKTNTQTAKTTVTKKEVNKNKEVKKVPERKKKESDFDELDDQDILAMLSGGIILDECSGSDDD